MALDLDAIRAKWLQVCGACDAGIGQQCSHPGDDYRPVILDLLTEVATLTEEFAEARAAMDPAVIEAERAEVAALTAERDRLRERLTQFEADDDYLGGVVDGLESQLGATQRELVATVAARDAALASLTEAREQTARMRPVVESARDFEEFWRGRPELESVAGRRWSVLYGALHALDAGAAAGGEGATW